MGHTSGHASGRVRQQGDSTALATRRVLPGAGFEGRNLSFFNTYVQIFNVCHVHANNVHTTYGMYMQIMSILPMVCTFKPCLQRDLNSPWSYRL